MVHTSLHITENTTIVSLLCRVIIYREHPAHGGSQQALMPAVGASPLGSKPAPNPPFVLPHCHGDAPPAGLGHPEGAELSVEGTGDGAEGQFSPPGTDAPWQGCCSSRFLQGPAPPSSTHGSSSIWKVQPLASPGLGSSRVVADGAQRSPGWLCSDPRGISLPTASPASL